MTKAEVEALLNGRIFMCTDDDVDVDNVRVAVKLFRAQGYPVGLFMMCTTDQEADLSEYVTPDDNLVDAVYSIVIAQLAAGGVAPGSLTDLKYVYMEPETGNLTPVVIVDGKYINGETEYPAEHCYPHVRNIITTAIIGDLADGY